MTEPPTDSTTDSTNRPISPSEYLAFDGFIFRLLAIAFTVLASAVFVGILHLIGYLSQR